MANCQGRKSGYYKHVVNTAQRSPPFFSLWTPLTYFTPWNPKPCLKRSHNFIMKYLVLYNIFYVLEEYSQFTIPILLQQNLIWAPVKNHC